MDLKNIEVKLQDISGFKYLFRGLFASKKIKKSFNIYANANKKGVFPLYQLRLLKYEDSEYAIYAFSTKGEISKEIIKDLEKIVMPIPLSTVRYESISYSYLKLWRGEIGSLANEESSISDISSNYSDILIFPVATQVDCPCIIYAEKDKEHYIYPVSNKQVKKMDL